MTFGHPPAKIKQHMMPVWKLARKLGVTTGEVRDVAARVGVEHRPNPFTTLRDKEVEAISSYIQKKEKGGDHPTL